MQTGDVVRPVVSIAGLESTRLYRLAHFEAPSPFASVAFLETEGGALVVVENAHLVLEKALPSTLKPRPAASN